MKYIYENIDDNKILNKYYKNNIYGTEIKKIKDFSHPVFNQYGLFSTKNWNPYDVIGEYTGKVIDYLKTGNYLVGFENISLFINVDAEYEGNECRYINHYKNIKDKPNCKYVTSFINRKPIILIVVIEKIKIGEEILSDYCFNFK